MAVEESGLSGKALKNAQAYNRAMRKAEESLSQQKKFFDDISTTLLGVDGGKFFRELTNDELAAKTEELSSKVKDLKVASAESANEMNAGFTALLDGSAIGGLEEITDKLGLNAVEAEKFAKHFDQDGGVNFTALSEDLGDFADDFVGKIANSDLDKSLVDPFVASVEEGKEMNVELKKAQDAVKNMESTTFSLASGLQAVGRNIGQTFSFKNLIAGAMEYNQTIADAQQKYSINFSENTAGMAALTSETAKFGMNAGEATELMGSLSQQLRTTNFEKLADAAKDMAMMQKSTGLNTEEMSKLSKEYLKFGKTSEQMMDDAAATMNDARIYGVSGNEVMQEMSKNMSKMRTMGFTGGEASLRKMVLESKRLGMSVDEVFETGKRARNIEGAMEMAAELQLAGGSFAAIDPMQLLSAARKGPEEMQKILGQMGKDIGHFNADGEYKFDPVDKDRLQMVADATGQSMESLTNMIAQNAEDAQKVDLLGGLGADLENLDDKEKAFLMQMTSKDKNGNISFSGELEGIDDFSQINKTSIEAAMAAEKEKKESLAKQAEENQSLNDSIKALKDSIFNALVPFFNPVIKWLTGFVQAINNAGPFLKGVFGILMATLAVLFGPAKAYLNGIAQGRGFAIGSKGGGFLKGIKSVFKSGGGAAGAAGAVQGPKPPPSPGGGAGQGWIAKLAMGIKSFSRVKMKDILMLGFALTVIGAAVAVFMLGIAATGGPDGAQLAAAAASMIIMAGGLWLATKIMGKMSMKDVLLGAAAMAIMGVALIPFAYAALMMSEVDWVNVLAGVGVAMLVIFALTALGMAMVFGMPLLLYGAGALAIAGVALLVGAVLMGMAGDYLLKAIGPLEMIKEADWSGLYPFAAALSSFGFGTIAAGIGLLIGSAMLAAAAPMLALAAPMLIDLAETNWKGLVTLASGLNTLGPALIGFALAGLAFFNPFVLFGVALMLEALHELKGTMVSLGPNLAMGADGIERMAAGVLQLESAVKGMNVSKLEKLAEIMAEGGAEMGKFVAEVNKAESSKVTHVVQLQIDGKDLQEIILKDTKHST